MTDQLARVEARIESAGQLSSVVAAMRNIAAVRAREARRHIDGIRAYAATIGTAIGEALSLAETPAPEPVHAAANRHLAILFCSEQGFVGAFNDTLFDALAGPDVQPAGDGVELLLVGDRGLAVADERRIAIAWSTPMIVHPEQAGELAGRLSQVILERIPQHGGLRVDILHAQPRAAEGAGIVARRIIPFDYSRFPVGNGGFRPLTTLAPQALLARLVEEYVFAELCEAIMLAFVAENEHRVRAMTAAGSNIDASLAELVSLSRQLRQEAITTEIIELAGSSLSR